MNPNPRWVFGVCQAASLALIAASLHFWGAAEIRADVFEVLFLTIAGLIWLMLASALFPWFGLSLRDDAMERNNRGALVALCGGLFAVAFIYMGGSVGEGPSYFNNLFCVVLGTASLFLLWMTLEFAGKISRSIAEERDQATGMRLCGFLLAAGLVLGRALAGNWHSEADTFRDFLHDGWPAVAICVLAMLIERFARPSRQRPFPAWTRYGMIPGLVYLALAGAWLWHLGPWEGMSK